MPKVAVTGSKGRMGSRIVKMLAGDRFFSLAAELDIGDSLDDVIDSVDVVIDFTVPEAAARHAAIAARHNTPIVIGTTGLGDDQQKTVSEASHTIPIVHSPNMGLGVNVMLKLTEITAKTLGKKYKVDIVETHHAGKRDKPSGTALRMLDIVCKESGRNMNEDVFFYEEEAETKDTEEESEVSVRSIRRGEVVGEHVIYFTSPGEILSIEHRATNRDIFAEGAIAAARWIIGKAAGLYGIEDVLNLKTI